MSSNYIVIKDPIHGYIKVYEHELKIIDTYAFQRLRRLKQLPTSQWVYPGATHTRFSHSLGVMHVAGVLTENLLSKAGVKEREKERYIFIMRLWGLLHDIGHGPFSHTFEDHILVNYGTTHEIIGKRIILENGEIRPIIDKVTNELGIDAKTLADLLEAPSIELWPLNEVVGEESITTKSLFYVAKGAISADIIDYLLRDSYYTGAFYGLTIDWQRIAQFSKIVSDKVVIEAKAKEVFDSMLLARLLMFKTVYYHKTSRAVDHMLGKLLKKADEILGFEEYVKDPNKYVELDDDFILSHPEVRKTPEALLILKRHIPYSTVSEEVVSVRDALLYNLLDRVFINRLLRSKIEGRGIKLGDDAFFVDTPKLHLNPMFADEYIYVQDSRGNILAKRIWETLWGELPHSIAILRLYVNEDIGDRERNLIVSLFNEIIRGSELRSFY